MPAIIGGTISIYYTFGADGTLDAYGDFNGTIGGSGTCADSGTYSVSGNVIYVSGFGAPVTTGALAGHCDLGSPTSGPLGTYSVSGNQLIINMNYGSSTFEAIFSRQ